MPAQSRERCDDYEAIAAARAAFWARWRGESSSDTNAGVCSPPVKLSQARASSRPLVAPPMQPSGPNGARRRMAESLSAWFERCIERELKRCEQSMTPDDWHAHRGWIEEHARTSLWDALAQRAASGTLRTEETPCIAPKI